MNCPNCNKHSVCFCSNCKKRRKMPIYRTEIVMKTLDMLKCPYCRTIFSFDYLEYLAFQEIEEYDKKMIFQEQVNG